VKLTLRELQGKRAPNKLRYIFLQNEEERFNSEFSDVVMKSSSSFQNEGSSSEINSGNDQKIKPRILLIDDDKEIAEMFRMGLTMMGFQVEAFNDPKLLLEKFQPDKYDVLITDFVMPSINGIELYDRIKKLDSKIKVFFLSAYEIFDKETKKSLELSPNSFIRKPISIESLANLIDPDL